jgi:archaellum component FlaC
LFGKDSKCSESIQDVQKEMENGRKTIKKVRKVFEKLSESNRRMLEMYSVAPAEYTPVRNKCGPEVSA